MARLLEPLEDRIAKRFASYRRMCGHLGVPRGEDAPRTRTAAVRRALMTCLACPRGDLCRVWVRNGHDGAPLFCPARQAFQDLAEPGEEDAVRTAAPLPA